MVGLWDLICATIPPWHLPIESKKQNNSSRAVRGKRSSCCAFLQFHFPCPSLPDSIPLSLSLSHFLSRHHPSLSGNRLKHHLGLTESTPTTSSTTSTTPYIWSTCQVTQWGSTWLFPQPGTSCPPGTALPPLPVRRPTTGTEWEKQHLHCGKAAWVMNPELRGFLPVEAWY